MESLALNGSGSPPPGNTTGDDGGKNSERLAVLKRQIAEITRERALQTDKLTQMGQHVDLLQQQKQEFESQVGVLRAELDSLSGERNALENSISELTNKIRVTEAEHREISEQKEKAWEAERQGLVAALSESSQRISDLDAAVKDLEARNDALSEQSIESNRLVDQVFVEKEELLVRVASVNKQAEMLGEENERLRAEIAAKAEALWNSENEIRALNAKIAVTEEERETLRAEIARTVGEGNALERRLAEAMRLSSESKGGCDRIVEDLLAENDHLRSENGVLLRKIDDMAAPHTELSRQLDFLREEHARLAGDKEEHRKQIESLIATQLSLEKERALLSGELEEASRCLDDRSEELRRARSKEVELETRVAEMQSELEAATSAEIEASIALKRVELENLRETSRKEADLENRVFELQAELAVMMSSHSEVSITLRKIREDRESLDQKMRLQCSRNKELEDELISVRSSFEMMKQAAEKNQEHIYDLEQQVSSIASEKKSLEHANTLLETELKTLSSARADHDQFGERKMSLETTQDSAYMDSESGDVNVQRPSSDHQACQPPPDDQLRERIRDLEIALDAANKGLATREITVQQLTSDLQSLQLSFETDKKGKKIAWPAVAASTATVVAAAYIVYVKWSKQR